MRRLQSIFSNTFTLLLLLMIALTTVFVVSRQNLIGSGGGVEAQTVVATQETGMIVARSPLAPPTVTPTPKPPIDVSKLEIVNIEQVAPSPFYYSLSSPDSRYALVNKNEVYQGHQLVQANDGDPSGVTGTWIRTHDLWLVDQKTKEENLIASNATNWWWNLDSSAFSYVTPVEKQGVAGTLNVYSPLEKTPRQIAKVDLVQGYTQGVWLSPEEIMYIAEGRLWSIQRDGSNNRPLHNLRLGQIGSDQVKELAEYTGNVDEFVISTDGKRIAYTLSIPGPSKYPRDAHISAKSELWVSDIDGQNPMLITDDGIVLDWSPDGNWIVYSSTAFPNIERTAARNLNVVNLETGNQHLLYKASTAFSAADNITWSPRGDVLAFRELIPAEQWIYNLWFTNLDGSKQKTFQNLEAISQPSMWIAWEEGENEDYLLVTIPSSVDKQKQAHRVKLMTSP